MALPPSSPGPEPARALEPPGSWTSRLGELSRSAGLRPRWGVTSFVVPGSWQDNVQLLGPTFDDIELLFFESAAESLPSKAELDRLREQKQRFDLSYSVHTPLDVSLASESSTARAHAVDAVQRCIERSMPLEPEAFIVHVYLGDQERDPAPPRDWDAWRDRARTSLARLCRVVPNTRQLCVESLDYDLGLLLPVLEDLDLAVALDVGHLARDHRALDQYLASFLPRTRVIQIHGTDHERDHRSLEHFPASVAAQLLGDLRRADYQGVLTLEVFDPTQLQRSLRTMERWLERLE